MRRGPSEFPSSAARLVLAKPDLDLLLANNGGAARDGDLQAVNRAIRRSGLRPKLTAANAAAMDIEADGCAAAIGLLAAIVIEAVYAGTWRRLKACRGDACHYAFYDHSRNSSRSWCDMARCGSRSKMRAYRKRIARSARGVSD